jgi:four helix bundle protein
MRNDKKNLIIEMSTQFSVEIIEFCEQLKSGNKSLLGKQLFRAGTSIGANIREAQNAESLKDFIHKFKIAAKEADESAYWLDLCSKSELYPTSEKLEKDLESMIRVISKIISSSKSQ